MDKTIAITGGGTGGHLSVAKAFLEELYDRGYKVIFIGSLKGQDRLWFENEDKFYKKYFFDTTGVVNQKGLAKLKALKLISNAVLETKKIFKYHNVSKVISVGGFSAASGSFGAILSGIDLYIHEQNSVMGKLNKITSYFAKEVFSSYLETSKVKDYPIKEDIFKHYRVRKEIKSIIFLGGSQGAKAINDFAINISSKLQDRDISIIHQCGKNDFKRVKEIYEQKNIEVELFDFSHNIIEKISKADFAVSRAGASTLWELVALGVPTLFIPYPYAAANHQYYNAKFLEEKKLAFIRSQDKLDSKLLLNILDTANIEYISENLQTLIKPNGVKNMIDIIEKE